MSFGLPRRQWLRTSRGASGRRAHPRSGCKASSGGTRTPMLRIEASRHPVVVPVHPVVRLLNRCRHRVAGPDRSVRTWSSRLGGGQGRCPLSRSLVRGLRRCGPCVRAVGDRCGKSRAGSLVWLRTRLQWLFGRVGQFLGAWSFRLSCRSRSGLVYGPAAKSSAVCRGFQLRCGWASVCIRSRICGWCSSKAGRSERMRGSMWKLCRGGGELVTHSRELP